MGKLEAIERWRTADGDKLRKLVLRAIAFNRPLKTIQGIDQLGGKFDLRGLSASHIRVGRERQIGDFGVTPAVGRTSFNGVRLVGADLSHSNFTYSMWTGCTTEDCVLDYADFSHAGFWGCKLNNVSLRNANLTETTLGGVKGRIPNEFHHVDFSNAKMRAYSTGFPLYDHCRFEDTDLKKVNFDGSRFQDCVFVGKLDEVEFRKHARQTPTPVLPWQKVDPKSFTNEMARIDFTRAELRGVDFGGAGLSTCKFPVDDHHLVVYNQWSVFQAARQEVAAHWRDPDRASALHILDKIYLQPQKQDQPIEVINKLDDEEYFGAAFADRFFALIRDLNNRYATRK